MSLQALIKYLEEEAQKKLNKSQDLEKMLNKRDAKILELERQVSSQEESITQWESNLSERSSHLNSLITLMEQLYEAQDEKQDHKVNLTLCRREATYYREHAKELRSMVCNVLATYM